MTRALKLALVVAVILLTVFVVRALNARRSLPLQPWHTDVPNEMRAAELFSDFAHDWNRSFVLLAWRFGGIG